MKEINIEQADARSKLLKAAAEIFAVNGFKGATVREICKSANQAVGAVNYHFRDKQGLYEAVFRATMEELIQNMSPIPANVEALTSEQKLHFFVKTYLNRFGKLFNEEDRGTKAFLMMREVLNPTESFTRMFKEFQTSQKNYLLQIISELTGLKKDDPAVIRSAVSVIGQCFQFVFGRRIFGILGMETIHAEEISICADHIVTFTIGGLKAITGELK